VVGILARLAGLLGRQPERGSIACNRLFGRGRRGGTRHRLGETRGFYEVMPHPSLVVSPRRWSGLLHDPATTPAPASEPLLPSTCQNALTAAGFDEEAALEYEAWLDEVAEAHARQLDDEADRYARSYAGAGWTEFLMASEG
jgi:hypothetical protein